MDRLRQMNRGVYWITLIAGVGVMAAGLLAWAAVREPGPDVQLVLVARQMAYYIEGGPAAAPDEPNPLLRLPSDATVTITLRNEDPGMLHDLVLPGLNLRTEPLNLGQSQKLVFRTPTRAMSGEYFCSLHPQMMRGELALGD